MAYNKTVWKDLPDNTTPITASNLNKIENELEVLDITATTLDGKIDTQVGIVDDKIDSEVAIIDGKIGGEEYDSTATYEIGDFCIYNNKLYRCTTAISTAEAFTPAHWEETSVENELDALRKSGGIPTNSVIGYDGSTIPSGFEETDGPNDYSTTEKVIGIYDDKPLYRKLIYAGQPSISAGTTYTVAHNISNLKIVTDVKCTFVNNTYTTNYHLPYFDGNSSLVIREVTNTNVLFKCVGSSWGGHHCWIALEYTKTTD